MRRLLLVLTLPVLLSLSLHADKVALQGGRFTLEFPEGWKDAKGPDDNNILNREAPDGEGAFAVYKLKVAKDHRADLKGTLDDRIVNIAKSGMSVTGDTKAQKQKFDGKDAIFGVIPVEADAGGEKVQFAYYLVLIDAKDTVFIMQATLPRKPSNKLREAALSIIQSFREKEPAKEKK